MKKWLKTKLIAIWFAVPGKQYDYIVDGIDMPSWMLKDNTLSEGLDDAQRQFWLADILEEAAYERGAAIEKFSRLHYSKRRLRAAAARHRAKGEASVAFSQAVSLERLAQSHDGEFYS